MSTFINTVDKIGEEALVSALMSGTLTELYDDRVTVVGNYALAYFYSLTTINLPNVTEIEKNAFYYCSALVDVILPKVTKVSANSFGNCSKLKILDLPSVTDMDTGISSPFYSCTLLTHIVLRSDTMCKISAYTFGTSLILGNGKGYAYVPAALIDTYKADQNWSAVASRLRVLEDYTVDGTITGALDESKI